MIDTLVHEPAVDACRFPLDAVKRRLEALLMTATDALRWRGLAVEPNAIVHRAILELHRVDQQSLMNDDVLRQYLDETVAQMCFPRSLLPTDVPPLPALDFGRVDEPTAEAFYRVRHYLAGTHRPGHHYGLFLPAKGQSAPSLVGLGTIVSFDLRHLATALPAGVTSDSAVVLARLAVVSWAPKNAASYLLGRIRAALRNERPLRDWLVTYLDQNLGFSGAVYRASGFRPIARELKRRYLYLDRRYVTDRQMIGAYGTSDIRRLREQVGNRIEESHFSLEPLIVFASQVRRSAQRPLPNALYTVSPRAL